MAAQDFKPRRKPVTYGKRSSNRPLPMRNFLDPDVDTGAGKSSSISAKLASGNGQSLQKRSHLGVHELPREDACSGPRSPISPNSFQDKSDNTPNDSTNSSVFDLMSSDEDMDRPLAVQLTRKRRRLTPVRRFAKQVQGVRQEGIAITATHKAHAQDTATAQSAEITSDSSASDCPQVQSKTLPQSAATSKLRKGIPPSTNSAAAQVTVDVLGSEEGVRVVSLTSSPTPPHTPIGRSPRTQRSKSASPSAQLIDQLNKSLPLESRLTKRGDRMRGQVNDTNPMPSPSQLAMRSLRLTPEEKLPSEMGREGSHVSLGPPVSLTPSRSRRRLVDALDSPRSRSKIWHISVESSSSSTESPVNDDDDGGDDGGGNNDGPARSISQRISGTRNNPLEKRTEVESKLIPPLPVTGPKVTYAKQRSHLSDMVFEDPSDLALPSMTPLAEPMASTKACVSLGLASQGSQDEPKDADDAGSGAIRSIHELRLAGENSRFQGNLDSIFEDLEAAGRTGRSRRLRGLMQLSEKFLEPTFCQRFVENGMHQRLASHAFKETDVLSSTLISCALSILLSSNKPSLKMLQQVFDAVMHSSAPLLKETQELSKFVRAIAKDRKQNLSGAMCKDVIAFQQPVLASRMWTTEKPTSLSPRLLALRSIELVIRGIRELKDFETSLPQPLFMQLVDILETIVQTDGASLDAPESVLTVESAISVLEFSALSHRLLEGGYNEAAKRLYVLGPLLREAGGILKERRRKTQQLVLRLIISVTNNNVELCESLGQTPLIRAIAAIVKTNFLELAEYADSGKELDESTLESVILALGSLINFAECSHSSRLSMNTKGDAGESTVEWLVVAFARRAGKVSEVLVQLARIRYKVADTPTGIVY
jgi:hypothetical protein